MWKTRLPEGFTLLELLITMGLMAVISGGIISAIGQGPRMSQRDGTRKSHIEAIRSALEIYRNDKRGYPLLTGWETSLTGGSYISAVPTDPRVPATHYVYTPSNCGASVCTGYQVCATLERASDPDYPNYCRNNP